METEKIIVKPFKLSPNENWWCAMKHFTILNGVLICAAGGEPTDEEIAHMKKYLHGKKLL